MIEHAIDRESGTRRRRRRSKHKRRHKSRRRADLLHNLAWVAGGLAVGLPVLALAVWFASRY